jgi:putative membrane protein
MNEINSLSNLVTAEPNLNLARRLHWINAILTLTVLVVVGLMRRVKVPLPEGISFDFLPPIYSLINLFAALLLLLALTAIKQRKVRLHKLAINAAMGCSMIFLICYVVYHFTTEETQFGGMGWIRPVYFTLLISHIVLAAISLPLILLAWTYGMTNQFSKHRRLVRFVFPIWLYVTLSGPACFLMLRPYY